MHQIGKMQTQFRVISFRENFAPILTLLGYMIVQNKQKMIRK